MYWEIEGLIVSIFIEVTVGRLLELIEKENYVGFFAKTVFEFVQQIDELKIVGFFLIEDRTMIILKPGQTVV